MGCFLSQQRGLCRFRAHSPSQGLPQALTSSSAMAPGEPQPWHEFTEAVSQRGLCRLLEPLTACDRQAGSCLSPSGCSNPSSCWETLQQKNHTHSSAAPLRGFGHKAHSRVCVHSPSWVPLQRWSDKVLVGSVQGPQRVGKTLTKLPGTSRLLPQHCFFQTS